MTADTFERSCAHWSAQGEREMQQFYSIASVDYEHLADARDWRKWLTDHQEAAPAPLKLLDVACGSGKFPAALLRRFEGDGAVPGEIAYSLLDPARFSIDEARSVLKPPFSPGAEYEVTLQALDVAENAFDVAWATHALYAMPREELVEGLGRLIAACEREIFIAHAFAEGHYIRFQELFLEAFARQGETPYCSAQDLIAALDTLGARYEVSEISYANGAASEQRDVVEGFLQRCVFDESVSLTEMEASPVLGPYLRECQTNERWSFEQRVALITIRP